MPTRYFLSPPFIAAAPTAADFAQVSPASPSPISCCLSGASPAPGPRMPAVPAPHLEVHGCKRPRRDRWPRERGAGREHPALTPLADGSGAWASMAPSRVLSRGELQSRGTAHHSLRWTVPLPLPHSSQSPASLHKTQTCPQGPGSGSVPRVVGGAGGATQPGSSSPVLPLPTSHTPAEVRARHPTRAAGRTRVSSPEGARGPHLRVWGCHHGGRCPQSHPAHHDPEGQALGGGRWRVHQQAEGE